MSETNRPGEENSLFERIKELQQKDIENGIKDDTLRQIKVEDCTEKDAEVGEALVSIFRQIKNEGGAKAENMEAVVTTVKHLHEHLNKDREKSAFIAWLNNRLTFLFYKGDFFNLSPEDQRTVLKELNDLVDLILG